MHLIDNIFYVSMIVLLLILEYGAWRLNWGYKHYLISKKYWGIFVSGDSPKSYETRYKISITFALVMMTFIYALFLYSK